jgi:hypothetical protein
MATPDDLVSLDVAAKMAQRSPRTIRRWTSVGHLTRYDGPTPPGGGSALALVSTSELLGYLATSEQQPRHDADGERAGQGEDTRTETRVDVPAMQADTHPDAARIARLEAAVEVATLRGRVDTLTAERNALRDQVENLEAMHGREVATLRDALDTAREDGAAWRARAVAVEAELRQLRQERGLPWWRRLLGGPAPEPPELPGWTVEQLPPEAK